MKIELKCLHFSNVLLSLANVLISVLSEHLVMLNVYIVIPGTCLQENRHLHCNLTKSVYFFKIFQLV